MIVRYTHTSGPKVMHLLSLEHFFFPPVFFSCLANYKAETTRDFKDARTSI